MGQEEVFDRQARCEHQGEGWGRHRQRAQAALQAPPPLPAEVKQPKTGADEERVDGRYFRHGRGTSFAS